MVHPDQMKHIKRKSWRARPMHVLIDEIERNPNYPQRKLHDAKMQRVEESIREKGFDESQPLKVRPHPTKKGKYVLVDGHRRYEALLRQGKGKIEVPVEIVSDEHQKVDSAPKKTVYDGTVRQKKQKKSWWKKLFPF